VEQIGVRTVAALRKWAGVLRRALRTQPAHRIPQAALRESQVKVPARERMRMAAARPTPQTAQREREHRLTTSVLRQAAVVWIVVQASPVMAASRNTMPAHQRTEARLGIAQAVRCTGAKLLVGLLDHAIGVFPLIALAVPTFTVAVQVIGQVVSATAGLAGGIGLILAIGGHGFIQASGSAVGFPRRQ
jgi:hypothetical protein